MRLSAKGRYALAAMTAMARQHGSGESVTVISISEKLGISKIYLEQVFALLKKAGVVTSTKGAQGGYRLTRPPERLTALEVLSAVEVSLFEHSQATVLEKAPDIEKALELSVFDPLDQSIKNTLEGVTMADLVGEAEKHGENRAMMFYI